jgi:hypothetical protein
MNPMSDFALKPAAARAPALHIGLDREEIVRKVDRGSVEIGLLSLGWQPPRTSSRR